MNRSDGQGTRAGETREQDPATDQIALSAADAAAVDALVESGWNSQGIDQQARERERRLVAIFELLGSGDAKGSRDSALIDAVLVRVAKARARAGALDAAAAPALHPEDARTTDALVAAGFEVERIAEPFRARAQHQHRLLSLLDGNATATRSSEDLMSRTLATVQRAAERDAAAFSIEAEAGRIRSRRFQFADLVSVAALLLIGTAVLWPILSGTMQYNRRLACQANMQAASLGFGQYARDFRDFLPMASASPAGNPWWEVGRSPEFSNSANQYTLARASYAKVADLACTGNPNACRAEPRPGAVDWERLGQVSYSYRIMFGRASRTLTPTGESVLLADRSPMVIVGPATLTIYPFRNSANHGGKGQNVLTGDGSVAFMQTPVTRAGDNLWLPRFIEVALSRLGRPSDSEQIKGTETPAADEDAFVGP